jgi:hypothetical protein
MKLICLFFLLSVSMLIPVYGLEKGEGNFINTTAAIVSDTIIIDGRQNGLSFDGVGAISAGASSRLLYDYPEPERGQILDYLFKPNYGASLQLLKVEIGSDMNSTDGSEASHMRTPDDLNCNRGYEWWLMKEAKARNPDIKLIGLCWGAPAWVEEFWSDATIDYILAWLDCARDNDLTIDYIGGWNERGWDADWYIVLDKALEKHYPNIQIIGADDLHHPWSIATEMTKNPELRKAVDVVGDHSACRWRSTYTECSSSEAAQNLGKPLWNAEHSSLGHDTGAIPLARAMNRLYIQGKITGNMVWSLVSAWYATLPIGDTGLLLAEWPWSGYYSVGKSIWVNAHTTQFVDIGWKYIDSASGFLSSGASFVTLQSPDGKDYSTVIEAVDAKEAQTVSFSVTGGLPTGKVHVWATDLQSDDEKEHFVKVREIEPEKGSFSLTVIPGLIYTLSTTTGQKKGTARPEERLSTQMSLPFEEDFDDYDEGDFARYFSDINGGFETVACGGGRDGLCYRQVVNLQPVSWEHASLRPSTVMGDPRWWGDYEVSVDVLLEEPGYVELLGRVAAQFDSTFVGYHLQINNNGEWKLYSQDYVKFGDWKKSLASGTVSFKLNEWHSLALKMKGNNINVVIDDKQVASVRDSYHTTGQIGLLVSPWQNAQFDNIDIKPTAEAPNLVPQREMKVTATSERPEIHRGYVYPAANAIDGRPETSWHTAWAPKPGLPQSITIDLGDSYKVNGLIYQPRLDTKHIINNTDGMITAYNIYTSADGKNFQKTASGEWPAGSSTKMARWLESQQARYVRLEATEGTGNAASAGEINVIME